MTILENYSNYNTYILVDSKYQVVNKNCINKVEAEDGIGGFSESEEFAALYVYNEKLYFQYENQKYETKPNELKCSNIYVNGNRHFQVEISGKIVCDITYKPYVSPIALVFGDDEDEFDYLLYLSKIMKDENSIKNFIKGIENLKKYYNVD